MPVESIATIQQNAADSSNPEEPRPLNAEVPGTTLPHFQEATPYHRSLKDTANFGNPARTQPLEGIRTISPHLPQMQNEQGDPAATNRVAKWLDENWSGRPSIEEKEQARTIYTFTANVFLRHLPPLQRAVVVDYLTNNTRNFLKWEKRLGSAAMTPHLFGYEIRVEPGARRSNDLIHEAVHVLQYEGFLPFNNALTYGVEQVLRLMQGKEKFISLREDDYPFLNDPHITRDEYFNRVLSGTTSDVLGGDWRLESGDLNHDRELGIYVEREEDFNREFAAFGEEIENRFGVRDPYQAMANVGSARGVRAYAVGYFSGNMDNAWTILWLHGRGMPFEDAERLVVRKILDGTIHEPYDFPEVQPADIEHLVASEKLFGTRKLVGKFESSNNLSILPRLRNFLDRLYPARMFIAEYLKSIKGHLEEVSPDEIRKRYTIFRKWLDEHTLMGINNGGKALDLSDMAFSIDPITWASILDNQEQSASMVFHERHGKSCATIAGVQRGIKVGSAYLSIANKASANLPEQGGIFHTHPLFNAPPSIPDLLQIANDPRRFISIVSSQDTVYAIVKPLETAISRQGMSITDRIKERANIIVEALGRIRHGEHLDDLYLEYANKLGLKVYEAKRVITTPPTQVGDNMLLLRYKG